MTQEKSKKKVVDYAYIKKETVYDKKLQVSQDKYTLLSIARNDILASEVYLNYFPSMYSNSYRLRRKQAKQPITKVLREDFSKFFMAFVEIITLRSLIGRKRGISGIGAGIINDIFDLKEESEQQKYLSSFIKNYIAYLSSEYIRQLFQDRQSVDYLQSAYKVQIKIQQTLKQLYKEWKLDTSDRQQLKKSIINLKQTQQLPDKLDDQQVVKYIKYNFECICNIQCLRKMYKKQIWEEFYHLHKNYIMMNIEFIMDTKMNPKKNQITLPAVTEEVNPIIMTLEAYLNLYSELGEGEGQADRENCLLALSRDIIEFCNKYNKITKKYYPNISINDIFFDQKKLAMAVSYESLLMDVVGLKENTKSYELRLATEATPKGIDYGKTYLQIEKRLLLNEKYYCPKKNNQKNDKNEQYQLLKVKEQPDKLLATLEQIHVEKLIRLIYFIQTQNNFTNDYYNGKFKKQQKGKTPKPFYKNEYQKVLKQIYQSVSASTLNIQQILTFPQQKQQVEKKGLSQEQIIAHADKNKKPALSFEYLKDKFGCGNEDSLLESLKYQSLRSHLYQLYLIYQQINSLIISKQSFKSLSNPKKYIFVYYTSKYQQLETFRLIKAKQKQLVKNQPNLSKRKLILQAFRQSLSLDFAGVNLMRQIMKANKIKKDASDKLMEYETRKDLSGKYIEKSKKFFMPIKAEVEKGHFSLDFFKKLENIIERLKDIIITLENVEVNQKNRVRHIYILEQHLQEIQRQLSDSMQGNESITLTKNYLKWFGLRIKQIKQKQKLAICETIRKIQQYFSLRMQLQIKTALAQTKKLTLQFISTQIEEQLRKSPQKLHSNQSNSSNWGKTCQYYNNKLSILINIFFYVNQHTRQRYQSNYKKFILGDKVKDEGFKFDEKIKMYSLVENKIKGGIKENLEIYQQQIKVTLVQSQNNQQQFRKQLKLFQQSSYGLQQIKKTQKFESGSYKIDNIQNSLYEYQQNILKQLNN